MRQSGVLAAMGLYALENNVERLSKDRELAQRFAEILKNEGRFVFPYGLVRTNLAFFCLPKHIFPEETEEEWRDDKLVQKIIRDFLADLKDRHGILVGSGYGRGGRVI